MGNTATNRKAKTMDQDRIVGAAKNMAGKLEGAIGQAAGDARTEMSGRAREAAGTAQNILGQAKDAVSDLGDSATGFAKDAIDRGADYYAEGNRAVASTVQNQPLGSLLLAGAIGFGLALFMRRSPPRRSRWDYRRYQD